MTVAIRTESGVFEVRAMAEETAVYRIFDANDVLLYVGMSVSPETRFADHRTCKPWMRKAYRYEIAWFSTRIEAETEEKRAVRAERPLHNSVHATRPVRPVAASVPGTYTMAEMAQRFGVSKTTIRAAARTVDFPPPVGGAPSGRRGLRYPAADTDRYWEQRQAGIKQGKRTDLATKTEQGENAVTQQQAKTRPLSTDARAILGIVWQWIADANDGHGSDVGDLMHELESAGYGPLEES